MLSALSTHKPPALAGKLLIAAGLVILSDVLLYNGPAGWTLAVYGGFVLLAACLAQPVFIRVRAGRTAILLMLPLIGALADDPTPLRLGVFTALLAALPIIYRYGGIPHPSSWLREAGLILKVIILRPLKDNRLVTKYLRYCAARNRRPQRDNYDALRYLLVPVVLSALFVLLFSRGNAVIANITHRLLPASFMPLLSPDRWLFWYASFAPVWLLLRPRYKSPRAVSTATMPRDFSRWLSTRSIVSSLVLFNLIFLFENGLDFVFLWHDRTALPDGISYAAYAHAGAYPLVATVLLAAAYVLAVFRDDAPAPRSKSLRYLVYAWIGQNIFLTFSAMNRLHNYINAYSLTQMRLCAFVWMALIALGLGLIVLRIVQDRSNRWLINANALMLAAALYGFCFVETGTLVANYNVRHAYQVTGDERDSPLDYYYMRDLGLDALPALNWYLSNARMSLNQEKRFKDLRKDIVEAALAERSDNWRAWTWHSQRLLPPAPDAATDR